MLKYRHIIIEGNIGAGKTTLATFLSESFKTSLLLEEFEENDFLKDFYKGNDFVLHAEVQFILDRSRQLFLFHKEQHELIVSDYTPTKSLIFSKMNLSAVDYELVEQLTRSLYKALPSPDLLIYLDRPVSSLKKNILKRGREYEVDIELSYLQKVEDAYKEYLKQEHNFPVIIIDAEEIDLSDKKVLKERFRKVLSTPFENRVRRLSING